MKTSYVLTAPTALLTMKTMMRLPAQQIFLPAQEIFEFAVVPPVTVNTMEEFTDVIRQFGVLVTPFVASEFAGVCPTRIYNMIEEGDLQKIVVYGAIHLPLRQVQGYMERRDERKKAC